MPAELPALELEDQPAFERLLAKEHSHSDGLWLKMAKKSPPAATITYAEAVEAALCYGWIDGHLKRLDRDYFVQRFTPRRARRRAGGGSTSTSTCSIEANARADAAGRRSGCG